MKKKFIKFLKDNDALIPFVCNLAMSDLPDAIEAKRCLFKYIALANKDTEHGDLLIDSAFDWDTTTEKYLFWSDLEDDWWLHNEKA